MKSLWERTLYEKRGTYFVAEITDHSRIIFSNKIYQRKEFVVLEKLIAIPSIVSGIVSGLIVSFLIYVVSVIRKHYRRSEQIRFIRNLICEIRDCYIFREHTHVDSRLLFFEGLLNRLKIVVDRRCSDLKFEQLEALDRIFTTRLKEASDKIERVIIFFQIMESEGDPLSFLKIRKWEGDDPFRILSGED